MRYKPPTIEGTGLEKWMLDRNLDYEEFCKRDDLGEPDAIIARAISPDPKNPIDRRTVAYYREVRKKERERNDSL